MYDLVGVDGNAFAIMGYVSRAMKQTGFSLAEVDAYRAEATRGDYMNLVAVSVEMIDLCNDRLEE